MLHNGFTSLCKNLFKLLEFLAEAFRCHVHHFQCLTVPVELAKYSSKLNKFLHREVNLLIQKTASPSFRTPSPQRNKMFLPCRRSNPGLLRVRQCLCGTATDIDICDSYTSCVSA